MGQCTCFNIPNSRRTQNIIESNLDFIENYEKQNENENGKQILLENQKILLKKLENDFNEEENTEIYNYESEAKILYPAPDFSLKGFFKGKISTFSLENYRNKNYLVLFFYPCNFSLVCISELITFSQNFNKFEKLNCSILAISSDSEYCHQEFAKIIMKKEKIALNFPLLSDKTLEITLSYGGISKKGFPLRTTCIIDKKGILKSIFQTDLAVGRNIAETFEIVKYLVKYDEEKNSLN